MINLRVQHTPQSLRFGKESQQSLPVTIQARTVQFAGHSCCGGNCRISDPIDTESTPPPIRKGLSKLV